MSAKKILAVALLLYPVLSVLAFALHFSSFPAFFNFYWERPPYDAGRLFDALAAGRGHGFVMAHTIVYFSVLFLLAVTLVLAWYLFPANAMLAFLGAAVGVAGCLAMAGVVATWLSYAAIGHVGAEYYPGARAALIELTRKEGFFKFNTGASYLAFIGLIILAVGLMIYRRLPVKYMVCVVLGSTLFLLFMDMDNWMLIGTLLISLGLAPVIKRLWS